MVEIDHVSFGGWENNLRLANRHAEVIVTLDVGPRIISYRTASGRNLLKTFAEQLGGTAERTWKSRGGHRFWLAPEDPVLSYIPDNVPVEHRVIATSEVEFVNPPTDLLPIGKVLVVSLANDSAAVTVRHRAENCGTDSRSVATWGLTVMNPGGVEIIPNPPLGEHPRDLLPNRNLILWPYTNMADPRWSWSERFLTLRQADAPPTKIGLALREGWVGYHCAGSLFLKRFEHDATASYPDGGCNFETFTDAEMLEVEALGPLSNLQPGDSTEHTEHWHLLDEVPPPASWIDAEITRWISPLLTRAGYPQNT